MKSPRREKTVIITFITINYYYKMASESRGARKNLKSLKELASPMWAGESCLEARSWPMQGGTVAKAE